MSEMEARLCHVSEELSEQMELQNSVLQRAQLAEQQVQDLRERLQGLETELLKADMHCDGLRHSKQHVSKVIVTGGKKLHLQVNMRELYIQLSMITVHF